MNWKPVFSRFTSRNPEFFQFTEWKPEISGTLCLKSETFLKSSGFYFENRKNFRVSFRNPEKFQFPFRKLEKFLGSIT